MHVRSKLAAIKVKELQRLSSIQWFKKEKLSGQTTDNESDEVLEHSRGKLQELGIIKEQHYFIANCTLNNLLLAVVVTTEKGFWSWWNR